MNWFLIALIPPALWSITNHFDKYLLAKYFKGGGVGALMIISSIVGLILLPFIILFHPEVLATFTPRYLLISLNGFFYLLATLPYFYALQKDEASITVPLFQLIPVFSFFLSYLVLGETLSSTQIIGGIIIIIGAVLISLDLNIQKKIKFKKEVFFLMALSSLLFAINFLFFKYFAINTHFWVTSFWEYVGFAIFASLLLIFIKSYRNEFFKVIKSNSLSVLSINGINEVLNIVAKASLNFASLLAPLTLIWIVNGFQPFFVFIYGVILTLFFPKISQENISKKVLFQKLLAILIMFVGAFFVNKS